MKQKLFSYINLHDISHLDGHWHHHPSQYLSIQYTGRLYNAKDIAISLHLSKQSNEATLILEGYRQWGDTLFDKLDGIFAFVIIDKKKGKIILVKDHVSIKSLYYYHDRDRLLFSSSLKELSNSKYYTKHLNHSALSNYFTYGYILQPNTIFKDCYKVKSGHYITIDIKTNVLKEKKYWDLGACYDTPKLDLSEEDVTERAKKLLKEAVKKRILQTDNFAASLSGGYDSSTIAAILQESTPHKIKTFTIGFEDTSLNEAPDAKKIAQHLGTEHIEHYFTAKDALYIVPKLSEIFDEPFYDNGSIPTTLLASLAKKEGIENIFAGDGGDEVFATADDIARFDRILATPQSLRNMIFKLLTLWNPTATPYFKNNKNIPTKYYKFAHILKAHNIPEMVKIKMTLFHPQEIQRLLKNNDTTFYSIFDELYFGQYAQSVDKVIGSYFKTFMTDGELIKTTQTFRAENIDIREPYLDKKLISFMAQVPAEIKIKNGVKKNLLKHIAHDYIPKPLLDRPKKGFSIPFGAWMRGELYPLLNDTLNQENLNKDGILDTTYVLELKNLFLSGKEEYKYKLWSILLYQLWYEKNIR